MPVYRSEMLNKLRSQHFDVLVIGGGITGAGIAQDAAHRGLKVALVEKGDFASGTSHASTKLLHGGIRYLEQGEVKLMYEALHERNRLTTLAPGLAEWLTFLIPIYSTGWQARRIGIGLSIYDLLAGFPKGRLHRWVPRDEALELAPYLKREGLRGAYLYYDARTDDTRLTIEVIRSAVKGGATVANYAEVTSLIHENGRVQGAMVQDRLEPQHPPFAVTADVVVNATGPWVDRTVSMDDPNSEPQLRPSKGTHLLVPAERLPVKSAVLAFSPTGDGRFVFVVPWLEGRVILGTTDTPYDDPDSVQPDKDDEAYILNAVNATFPDARLTPEDVISAYAGLRPLIKATNAGNTAQLSREHRIWTSSGGMINIAGGKLTTYRTMAIQATDRVLRQLGRPHVPSRTHEIPLGTDRRDGIRMLERVHPELAEPLVPGLPYTKSEVAYAAREEFAVLPDDFLARRTRIALLDRQHGEPQREEVAELLRRFGHPEGTPSPTEKPGVRPVRSQSASSFAG